MKNETRVPISRITLRALAILAAAGSINVATIPVQEHFVYNTQASTRFIQKITHLDHREQLLN